MFTLITALVTCIAALVLIGAFAASFNRSGGRRKPDLRAVRARARRAGRRPGRLP
jgi:hypothetical protein